MKLLSCLRRGKLVSTARKTVARRRPTLEALESRDLPSFVLNSLTGVLTGVGDESGPTSDNFQLSLASPGSTIIVARLNGQVQFQGTLGVNPGQVRQIVIDARDLNDSLLVDHVNGRISVTDGIDFTGGTGTDKLTLDDSKSLTAATASLKADVITGLNPGLGVKYAGIESLSILMGKGGDKFTVTDTTANVSTTIDGGPGSDKITVGANLLSGIRSPLIVTGGAVAAAGDALTLSDSANLAAGTGELTSSSATGFGMSSSGVRYSNFKTLTMKLGRGSDSLTVRSTHSGTISINSGSGNDRINLLAVAGPTTVNGAAGNDAFALGSLAPGLGGTTDGLAATVTLIGGSNNDSVAVDDSGMTGGKSYSLYSTSFSGLGPTGFGTLNYSQAENLTFRLGSGDDQFVFGSTAAGTSTSVFAGDGSDLIILGDSGAMESVVDLIDGSVTLDGGNDAGVDSLIVEEQFDSTLNTGALSATQITGLGMAVGVTYQEWETLDLNLARGGNVFTVTGTHAGTTNITCGTFFTSEPGGLDSITVTGSQGALSIDTGGEDDTIQLGGVVPPGTGSVVSGIQGPITINGGADGADHSDTIVIDDSGDTVGRSATIDPNHISGFGMPFTVQHTGIEVVIMNFGTGTDTLTDLGHPGVFLFVSGLP